MLHVCGEFTRQWMLVTIQTAHLAVSPVDGSYLLVEPLDALPTKPPTHIGHRAWHKPLCLVGLL
ncbi:hypothetical protein SXCC_02469 [Gluconacetobacter sp. SXCC-1]|nr:hypothetical protein SXCC_02469 [Gluconacetobacter sp. SXCC-1]